MSSAAFNRIADGLNEVARIQGAGVQVMEREDRLEEALERIARWTEAYPLEAFPEPDLAAARVVLRSAGLSLDAISASAMRHVITRVGQIAKDALL